MSGESTPGTTRVASLDSLRGLAILAVIAFHVSQDFGPSSWVSHLTLFGNQGVQLFFLVSAITMSLMWEQRAGEPRRQPKFYIRRFFRIAPLFWLAILFYTVWDAWKLAVPIGNVFTWKEIALTASFLHGFSPDAINRVVPGGWSIADEMNFYLVFPLLVWRKPTPERMLIVAFAAYVILGIVATTLIEHFIGPPPIFLYYSLLTEFPIFPLGIFMYLVIIRKDRFNSAWLLATITVWIAVAFIGKYAMHLNTRPYLWLQIALLATMIALVVRRGVSMAVVSFMGSLSYSMYLIHFAIIDLLKLCVPIEMRHGDLHFVAALIAVIAATTLVGKASSATFEAWSAIAARKVIAQFR